MDASKTASFLTVGSGNSAREIAYVLQEGEAERPMLVWLGGYRSDMTGTKAMVLEDYALKNGLACLRLDYSGHGQSGGKFTNGTISRWLEESLAVIDAVGARKLLLVGSSMGGWIALRAIQELRKSASGRVAGLVLIAPAPDFTAELIEPNLSAEARQMLEEKGYFTEVSEYSPEPNIFTKALIADGRNNLVLSGLIETGCPVHILQGMQDPDVPYEHALKLLNHLPSDNVVLTLIRDGDHRLSRPADLDRMVAAIGTIINDV